MKMCVWGAATIKNTQTQLVSLAKFAPLKNCTQLCIKLIQTCMKSSRKKLLLTFDS